MSYSVLTEKWLKIELQGFLPGFPTLPELLFFFLKTFCKRSGAVFLTCKVGEGEVDTCVMKR